MVIGGQAVLLYGEPRLTKDIDITLGIGVDKLKEIISLVRHLRLKILVDTFEDFVKKTMVLPVMDKKSGIRIDFVFSFSPYERQAIEKAKNVKIGTTTVKFASLEDVVIHKVIAGRARDIEDIKSILLKNLEYDHQYIIGWLKEFDNSLGENFLNTFKKALKEIQ
jgi:hypothetical protein